MGLNNIVEGNIKLIFGITTEEEEARYKICKTCKQYSTVFFERCKLCNCILRAKIKVKKEKCKLNKWENI